jgi:hypothetical protein
MRYLTVLLSYWVSHTAVLKNAFHRVGQGALERSLGNHCGKQQNVPLKKLSIMG